MAFVIGSDLGATWATIGFHDVPLLLATKRAVLAGAGGGGWGRDEAFALSSIRTENDRVNGLHMFVYIVPKTLEPVKLLDLTRGFGENIEV